MFISPLILGNEDLQYRCFLVGPQRDEKKNSYDYSIKKNYTEINFLSDITTNLHMATIFLNFILSYTHTCIHTHIYIIGHICC